MKRIFSVAALAALLLTAVAGTAHARSWRINNNVSRKAHFLDINAACASEEVQDGDTLYLDPGCNITTAQTISKRLTVIGPGFSGEAHQLAILQRDLSITASNTKVEGLYFTDGSIYFRCTSSGKYTDHITVERCRLDKGGIKTYFTNSNATLFRSQYNTIRQCYIANDAIVGSGATSEQTLGWTIENCIIRDNYSLASIRDLYQATIRNNDVTNTTSYEAIGELHSAVITNNIFLSRKLDYSYRNLTNCTMRSNVMACAEQTDYPNNTFLNMVYTEAEPLLFTLEGNDLDYQLTENSPAKGAGAEGEDCGPMSGNYPYVPYCRPYGIPYYTSASASTRPTNGQVKINHKVTIQKQ